MAYQETPNFIVMVDAVITPSAYERDSSAAGWAVAVIVLLGVVLFGVFVWPGIARTPSGNASTPGTIDVNVRLPEGQQGNAPSGVGSDSTQQNTSGSIQTPVTQ
ncbi:MAG: hypothetical protein A2854_03935 [Parcubacteria group bacterium RIFCSPHIGHO2_01_FULL_56_18]|nr:MAG: hypothetical protein A2854_03935 [Parcubacteria group bacterium RIFCSPHIGHO2_01_FULL_56_18]